MCQTYKIAICDDFAADRKYLSSLCEKDGAGITVIVYRFQNLHQQKIFLFYYAEKKDFDILLLDIEMGAMDGVTMARKLRQDNQTVQIIFITGYADYISDGYEVDALHYLMKPIQEEKLFAVLDRAVTKLIKNEKVLNIISQGEMIRLPICQINYAEVNSNYITIHSQQTITLKMTLSELEKKLDSHFFRAGRSALVNLEKISRVTKKEIYLQDGSIIPLPRGAYEKVNRAIINMD
ncbi:MAG: LytR/AlgR family response regulator transcription factor [Ruminococcus sp.]